MCNLVLISEFMLKLSIMSIFNFHFFPAFLFTLKQPMIFPYRVHCFVYINSEAIDATMLLAVIFLKKNVKALTLQPLNVINL